MYQHILIATDLSEASNRAAVKAKELADKVGAKLSIIHVVEPIPAYGYPGVTPIESPHIDEAKAALAEAANKFSISESDQHLKIGSTKYEILEVAEKVEADLIIVGSHGRHGLARLLGSTANAILHGAPCDILTVHAGN